MNQHIKYCLQIKNYKCEECKEAFVTQAELNDHMERKHSDERNYACNVKGCGKAFKTKGDLNAHKKSHSDKKPHQCPYCKKSYKQLGWLQHHVLKKHSEEYKAENDSKIEE